APRCLRLAIAVGNGHADWSSVPVAAEDDQVRTELEGVTDGCTWERLGGRTSLPGTAVVGVAVDHPAGLQHAGGGGPPAGRRLAEDVTRVHHGVAALDPHQLPPKARGQVDE